MDRREGMLSYYFHRSIGSMAGLHVPPPGFLQVPDHNPTLTVHSSSIGSGPIGSAFQGILDEEFLELLRLEGGSTLDLISEIVPIFIQEAVKVLAELRGFLDQDVVDIKKLEVQVYKLMSSSASMGASKLKNNCRIFLDCCKKGIRSESVESLLQMQTEVYMVRDCLETLIKLEMEICEDSAVSIANMGISGGGFGGNGGQSSESDV